MERSLMEVVDEGFNQVEDGEGKILATSLFNYAMPFIRYDTGDLGVLSSEKCPCGRPFPLLKELHGRSVDVFITPEGNRVHGWFFLYIFWEFDRGIVQYQVVQETVKTIVIYLIVDDEFDDSQLDQIREIIKEKSRNWSIEYRFVDEIPSTKSGKHKFIISKLEHEK
jgi:phenylacetate-CoA ligase